MITNRAMLAAGHHSKCDAPQHRSFGALQFTAQSFNVSNTPSYIIPLGSGNAEPGNTAFGKVTNYDPNYNPRQYQFALKLQF